MIRADLHIHTTYSPDAEINVETIIDQLYAHPTIKAIAITDHNTVEGYFKARQLATAYTDILIIPGVEISTTQGDIIILGTTELPARPWTAETIIDFAKETSSTTIAAHPYRPYGLGDATKNYALNAIETLNGVSAPHVNKMAEDLAKTLNLPGVAGSDAHNPTELWTVCNEIQASLDVDEILKAVRKGSVRPITTEKSIHF